MPTSKLPDLVFICRKCGHELYVDKTAMNKIETIPGYDCPNCGEEGYQNWILDRQGNYEKEYGDADK